MLALAFDRITSLSTKPISMITGFGEFIAGLSFIGIVWAVVMAMLCNTVGGWASIVCIVCFLSGIQLLSLGVIGECKIYMEIKARSRYIIGERTEEKNKK